MPIKVLGSVERKHRAGVVICRTHGALCKKYPDHPAVQERERRDRELSRELAEMVQAGHLMAHLRELVDAGFELPEELTRGNEDPPKSDRVRLFFERYDLGKQFRSDELYVEPPCKTRKLSDEEIRQRSEWAKAVREARLKRGQVDPTPPWEAKFDPELSEMIRRDRAADSEWNRKREAERAVRIQVLRDDEELARKLREALATWVNLPHPNAYTTPPEFEEME